MCKALRINKVQFGVLAVVSMYIFTLPYLARFSLDPGKVWDK